ncbi:hypothetical protein ACKXGF_07560 [Alkalibacillus sp. S2W]|uniref:hypothetical protein n=1 Tax=Alkalibacillus sp. S2W TaxID=3386553 RepID=UPI00398D5231
MNNELFELLLWVLGAGLTMLFAYLKSTKYGKLLTKYSTDYIKDKIENLLGPVKAQELFDLLGNAVSSVSDDLFNKILTDFNDKYKKNFKNLEEAGAFLLRKNTKFKITKKQSLKVVETVKKAIVLGLIKTDDGGKSNGDN